MLRSDVVEAADELFSKSVSILLGSMRIRLTPDDVPEPEESSTLTPIRLALEAMPTDLPADVPDTCVPWPLSSVLDEKAVKPILARLPNCS